MNKVVRALRAHVGVAAVSGVVVLGGAGVATAAIVTTSDATDTPAVTTPAETTAAAPTTEPASAESTDAPVPVEQSAEELPAATVGDVTDPTAEQPAPTDETEIADPETVGSFGEDGNYTPAPAPNRLPPVQLPPAPKLPNEPDYVPPVS